MKRSIIITKLISISKVLACIILAAMMSTVYAEYYIVYSPPQRVILVSSGCQTCHSCNRCYRRHVVIRRRHRVCNTCAYRGCSTCVYRRVCDTCTYRSSCNERDCSEDDTPANSFTEEYEFISPDFDMRTADDIANDP